MRQLFDKEQLNRYGDMNSFLERSSEQSRTTKLWVDCLIKPVFIMMMYVRAEREADWPLHLKAVQLMLPYFFAAGHVKYARYGLYYLRSMEGLPHNALKCFMNGEHVMRHIPGVWNAVWSGMFIESTFMRYGHGKRGIIGVTLKPETLKIWGLSLHICSRLEEDISLIISKENTKGQEKHKEEEKGRIQSDAKDRDSIRRKLEICIDPLDPAKHPPTIVNIVNGQIAAESVNIDNAIELGTQAMKQYESKWPEGFNENISKVVDFMTDSKKRVKVGDTKVFDTNLIYSMVIGLQASSRDVDILRLFSHELAPVPTSMFADSGDMRICTAKSALKKLLQSEVSARNIEKEITCTVVDGSAVLYVIHWPANGTLKDYVDNMKYYLGQLLQKRDVYLVFDRYKDYSTKSVTRSGRTTQASRIHSLNQAMPLPPQKVVLTVTDNKRQLIRIICEDLA